ncbi:MAG: DUF296 domain-containing protein [Phycisphaerae bacterium]|nr:DUF296 domain-containing protein [Phycisphaerae bacterium]
MEYSVGKAGRIIAARLYEGEDLYESIEKIAADENIACAAVFTTGGIRKADVVVGPKTETPKIEANFKQFTGPGETLGVGTIYCDETGQPKLHIHAAMQRGETSVIGCPRGGATTFLILEVTIIEILDIKAMRKKDPKTGFNLLAFE